MATFSKLSATPYSLSLLIGTGDGSATVLLTADLLNNMNAGPLKQLITEWTGHLDTFRDGQINHGKIRIRSVLGSDNTCKNPSAANVHFVTTGLSAQCDLTTSFMCELRMPHGEER